MQHVEEHYEYTTTLAASESRTYQTHIVVPPEIASALLSEGIKRVVATVTANVPEATCSSVEYQCGLIPRGNGRTVIMVNKEHRTNLGIDNGSVVRVTLRKDNSQYGLAMPEEFAEVLAQDDDGHRVFHLLPEGKRRTLIYIVSSQKSSARRIERALVVLTHLKARKGKLDYKALYKELNLKH